MQLMSVREKKTLETKEHIFEILEEMLEKYDFHYITVRNLCKLAEMSYGSFYHHFDSKENLFFLYGKRVFEKMLTEFPYPEGLKQKDYIRQITWSCSVYALFCEKMGWEFIKFVSQNSEADIFYDVCFEERVKKLLDKGMEEEYLHMNAEMLYLDIDIIYKGIIQYWCNSDDKKENLETVVDIMQRVLLKFLSSFATDKCLKEMTIKDFPEIMEMEQTVKLRGKKR